MSVLGYVRQWEALNQGALEGYSLSEYFNLALDFWKSRI